MYPLLLQKPDVFDHSQAQELAAVRQKQAEEAARYEQEICDLRKQVSREMQAKQQSQDEIQVHPMLASINHTFMYYAIP